jgi:hypothetical protein
MISSVELGQGQAFTRTSEPDGSHDTRQRVFKVLMSFPGEKYDPQEFCGVSIGSAHPDNSFLTCYEMDCKFDGDSRLVNIITFKYKNFASQFASDQMKTDPKRDAPNVRVANWTTSTTLVERPANIWRKYQGANGQDLWETPANPNGDLYDGVTIMRPITSFHVEQYESDDPIKHNKYCGWINKLTIDLTANTKYTFPVHTLMLRGITYKPHVETFGSQTFRGWLATYELLYDPNLVVLLKPDGSPPDVSDNQNDEIPFKQITVGWDRLQVLEGFNVLNARKDDTDVDWKALALKHIDGKILFTNGATSFADNVQNTITRAMVTVPEYQSGGLLQRPSSSPVALNVDGTPRNLWKVQQNGFRLQPLLTIQQTQYEFDMVNVLNLRLT